MDVRPILLSFQTAIIAILFTFVLGTGVAYIVFRLKNRKLKILLNSLFTLPLVLPPTVFGFFLLTIFGVQQPVGQFLLDFFAIQVVFSWPATVIAAVAVSFPLMYRWIVNCWRWPRHSGFRKVDILEKLRYLCR